jgi:hypothetical protein
MALTQGLRAVADREHVGRRRRTDLRQLRVVRQRNLRLRDVRVVRPDDRQHGGIADQRLGVLRSLGGIVQALRGVVERVRFDLELPAREAGRVGLLDREDRSVGDRLTDRSLRATEREIHPDLDRVSSRGRRR